MNDDRAESDYLLSIRSDELAAQARASQAHDQSCQPRRTSDDSLAVHRNCSRRCEPSSIRRLPWIAAAPYSRANLAIKSYPSETDGSRGVGKTKAELSISAKLIAPIISSSHIANQSRRMERVFKDLRINLFRPFRWLAKAAARASHKTNLNLPLN